MRGASYRASILKPRRQLVREEKWSWQTIAATFAVGSALLTAHCGIFSTAFLVRINPNLLEFFSIFDYIRLSLSYFGILSPTFFIVFIVAICGLDAYVTLHAASIVLKKDIRYKLNNDVLSILSYVIAMISVIIFLYIGYRYDIFPDNSILYLFSPFVFYFVPVFAFLRLVESVVSDTGRDLPGIKIIKILIIISVTTGAAYILGDLMGARELKGWVKNNTAVLKNGDRLPILVESDSVIVLKRGSDVEVYKPESVDKIILNRD